MTMSLDQPVLCPVLIGRTASLAALERVGAQVRAGRGHTVLVSGEAGSGKSRFVAAAAAHLGPEPVWIMQGHCFEQDRALPFAPLLDLLRTFLDALPPEERVAALAPDVPELVKLLPELARWFPAAHPTVALDAE